MALHAVSCLRYCSWDAGAGGPAAGAWSWPPALPAWQWVAHAVAASLVLWLNIFAKHNGVPQVHHLEGVYL